MSAPEPSSCDHKCATCPSRGSCPSSGAAQQPSSGCTPSKCATCPSRGTCGGGAPRVDPDIAEVRERMALVQRKLIVLSGKGGVGKSSTTVHLAFALAQRGLKVGICDLDICGPSVPTLTATVGSDVIQSSMGLVPVENHGLKIMSIGFLLGDPDAAVIWRGPRKSGLIRTFLKDVAWGELDVLLFDTPPGTSDEHLTITGLLTAIGMDGAIVVTTPQEVAMADVRKELNFCSKAELPVVGIVENMAGFCCPNCQTTTHIFQSSSSDPETMAASFSVALLGSVPLEVELMRACEMGEPLVGGKAKEAFSSIAAKLVEEES